VSVAEIQSAVLTWYASHGRDLAFRRTTDPWGILVSEVIAQQTQAARAAEAWTRFIARFPTPAALAGASPATVIRAWRGLGYNRRAVALRNAAIRIVEDHQGRLPDSLEALEALPGIGPYTARAVLVYAFGRPIAALDTNVQRVLDRALGPLPRGARARQVAADGFVPAPFAAAWSHALMDLGATICIARSPRCDVCPIRTWCRLKTSDDQGAEEIVGRRRSAPSAPFPSTTRWLRGRILDRLRDARDGFWITFDDPVGPHSVEAVQSEIRRLRADGLLESRGDSGHQARLVT
jgi:A/G-specific adenine glycosylase